MTPTYRDEDFEYDDQSEGTEDFAVSAEDFDDIFIVPTDWTVSTIADHLKRDINLDPDFQRRGVWNKPTKSKFIESLLLGIPIPQILLAEDRNHRGRFIVLDGKQRLLTIKEFLSGYFDDGKPFRLTDLRNMVELNNQDWQDLKKSPDLKRRFESGTIRTAILKGWKNDKVLYEIFYRLNNASVKLSPMELRLSLKRGAFLRDIVKWTEDIGELHGLLKLSRPDKRMADVELAVRHLAFSDSITPYNGNLKDYLDNYCDLRNKNYDPTKLKLELDNFNAAIKAAREVFGERAVCRRFIPELSKFDTRFNRAVFDVQVGALANESLREWALDGNQELVKSEYQELSNESFEFRTSTETTTKSINATRTRFSHWYERLSMLSNIKLKIPAISGNE